MGQPVLDGVSMKVVHVITDLERGGAEGLMASLIAATRDRVSHAVISLAGPGVWAEPLARSGVEVHCMRMHRSGVNPLRWLHVLRTLRDERAEVVQTWMYHADLVGGIMARIGGSGAVVWGIRNLTLPRNTSRQSTRLVRRLCAWLSGVVPDAIVCNSAATARHHRQLGYRSHDIVVIPNGIDTSVFRPDLVARARLRAEWKIDEKTRVIGMIARWDPQKDHATLIEALSRLGRQAYPVLCVLAGPGLEDGNVPLSQLLAAAGTSHSVRLLGSRDDVPAIMNALDLHVLSSRGESFPNVVAEAMACGTPCIVTDVGDAAAIVGDTGEIIRPGEPAEMAAAMRTLLSQSESGSRRMDCRRRIEERFGLGAMVDRYLSLWARVAAGRAS